MRIPLVEIQIANANCFTQYSLESCQYEKRKKKEKSNRDQNKCANNRKSSDIRS